MSLMPALFSLAAVVTMTEIAIKFEKAIPAIGSPGHEPWPEDGEEAAQQRGWESPAISVPQQEPRKKYRAHHRQALPQCREIPRWTRNFGESAVTATM